MKKEFKIDSTKIKETAGNLTKAAGKTAISVTTKTKDVVLA